jgi:serine/threonine protein kinase
MATMRHPFIVKLRFAFQTIDKLFLISDYCPGGDLSQYLEIERIFPEWKAKFYISEIVLAIEALHKKDVIFRDLKPDNVVLDEEGHTLLTDFGLSKEGVRQFGQGAKSFCGSYAYLAPEMVRK